MRRKERPDFGVFCAQDPGAETFEAFFTHQLQTVFEAAFVGVEGPVARVVAVEVEPGDAVGGVPFDVRVECGNVLFDLVVADVFRGGIWFLFFAGVASVPVISVDIRRAGCPWTAFLWGRTAARSRRSERSTDIRRQGRAWSNGCSGRTS